MQDSVERKRVCGRSQTILQLSNYHPCRKPVIPDGLAVGANQPTPARPSDANGQRVGIRAPDQDRDVHGDEGSCLTPAEAACITLSRTGSRFRPPRRVRPKVTDWHPI